MATGEEKAALILGRMPPELAEAVLTQLGPERASRLRPRVEEVRTNPTLQQSGDQALTDLRDLLRAVRTSQHLLTIPNTAESRTKPEAPNPGASAPPISEDPLADLKKLDPPILAAVLRGEHAPVVVLTLDCLPPEKAGDVLKLLAPSVRRETALRLGRTSARKPDLLREVARAVVHRARDLAGRAEDADPDANIKKLAGLLRNLDREDRKEILGTLDTQDPVVAEKIKKMLYVFEDLLKVEGRSLQDLLGQVDMRTLAVALRGAEADIKKKILENLSTRAGETLREELELLTSVTPAAVRQAQGTLVEVLQRMDQDGRLVFVE
jgi:flagellar motor switch protein FliG